MVQYGVAVLIIFLSVDGKGEKEKNDIVLSKNLKQKIIVRLTKKEQD